MCLVFPADGGLSLSALFIPEGILLVDDSSILAPVSPAMCFVAIASVVVLVFTGVIAAVDEGALNSSLLYPSPLCWQYSAAGVRQSLPTLSVAPAVWLASPVPTRRLLTPQFVLSAPATKNPINDGARSQVMSEQVFHEEDAHGELVQTKLAVLVQWPAVYSPKCD